MFQFLSRLLSGADACPVPRPRKTLEIEADLSGEGRGEIEYTEYSNGVRVCEIELRGLDAAAHSSLEWLVNGAPLNQWVKVSGDRVDHHLSTEAGDAVPELKIGDKLVLRSGRRAVLEGVARRD